MRILKYGRRYWAVYDETEALVCICVYKKGAREVSRRLALSTVAGAQGPVASHRPAGTRAKSITCGPYLATIEE